MKQFLIFILIAVVTAIVGPALMAPAAADEPCAINPCDPGDIIRQGKLGWLEGHEFNAVTKGVHGDQPCRVRRGNLKKEMCWKDENMYCRQCGNPVYRLDVFIPLSEVSLRSKNGDPGRDGKDGQPGPAGPAGRDGKDGVSGAAGKAGKDGAPALASVPPTTTPVATTPPPPTVNSVSWAAFMNDPVSVTTGQLPSPLVVTENRNVTYVEGDKTTIVATGGAASPTVTATGGAGGAGGAGGQGGAGGAGYGAAAVVSTSTSTSTTPTSAAHSEQSAAASAGGAN